MGRPRPPEVGGLLDRLRTVLAGSLAATGRAASRLIPEPTAWTLMGTALAFVAAFYFLRGDPALAGAFVALSGGLDVVDGAVARATGKVSQRGAFLDSTLDRVSEVALFTGVMGGGYTAPWVVLLALSLSLLVSYSRAKGDALGVSLAGVGVGERSERLAVLIVASLISEVGAGVALIAILAAATFVQRAARVTASLGAEKKKPAPR